MPWMESINFEYFKKIHRPNGPGGAIRIHTNLDNYKDISRADQVRKCDKQLSEEKQGVNPLLVGKRGLVDCPKGLFNIFWIFFFRLGLYRKQIVKKFLKERLSSRC